jgi:hypothetical protein
MTELSMRTIGMAVDGAVFGAGRVQKTAGLA